MEHIPQSDVLFKEFSIVVVRYWAPLCDSGNKQFELLVTELDIEEKCSSQCPAIPFLLKSPLRTLTLQYRSMARTNRLRHLLVRLIEWINNPHPHPPLFLTYPNQ